MSFSDGIRGRTVLDVLIVQECNLSSSKVFLFYILKKLGPGMDSTFQKREMTSTVLEMGGASRGTF